MSNIVRVTHTFPQRVQLLEFIKTRYSESKLTDNLFAELAAKELGFPLNARHILSVRLDFNIPANKPRRLIKETTSELKLYERVLILEQELAKLKTALGV